MPTFLQRPKHYFLSYSHRDAAFANALKGWLTGTAELNVWYDAADLPTGQQVHRGLAGGMGDCRGAVFLLSKHSLESAYVRTELGNALNERARTPQFQVLLLLLDDAKPEKVKELQALTWKPLAAADGPRLDLRTAAEILGRAHAFNGWPGRQGAAKEVYVSRGWREGEDEFAADLCRRLAARGLRLVGDLPDQKHTDPDRITRIMEGCGGHALILPRRSHPKGPAEAYKYFTAERELSRRLGLPRLVLTEPGCDLPPELAADDPLPVTPDAPPGPADGRIDDFDEGLVRPRRAAQAFFASEYKGNEDRNELARAVIEAVGTLPCVWGREITDADRPGSLPDRIADAIRAGGFVVADLTAPAAGGGRPAENVNSCVEAGIAWGAGVRLHCLAAANPEAVPGGKTKHVPFMFRNMQLELYDDAPPFLAPGVDFLGRVHRVVLRDQKEFGRRVINHEL